jgi:CubicO group peptidase (beta-lactamase class C family)
MRNLAIAVAVAAGCSNGTAPRAATTPRPASPHAELAARLDAVATRALEREGASVAGFSVAVAWRGDVVLARGYGLADVGKKRPVASDSIFRIGSVTKQFTAAAIMKLAAAGKVGLDDEITKYLPDYPARGKKITIRQLLTHTSGVKSFTELPWFLQAKEQIPRAELVAKFAAEPLDFDPGTRWHYSNSGYYLLGLVIENAAVGYRSKAGKLELAEPLSMDNPFAAGALCSTATDLVAWARALAGRRIVDEAAWKQMSTPVVLADGTTFAYGFGLFFAELSGHPSIGHNGGINGFSSALRTYPADDLYIAVLVNSESSLAELLSTELARAALGISEPRVVDVPIPAADAAAIAGTYRFDAIGISVEVYVDKGHVMIRNVGSARSARLRSQGDGSYLVPEVKAKVMFELKGGKVIKMRIEQGTAIEGNRVP